MNSSATSTRKNKDYFFFLKHMLKDKVCDMLFLKNDENNDMELNMRSDEVIINEPFREHLKESNCDLYSQFIQNVTKCKYLEREEVIDKGVDSPSLKIPPCLVSPNAKRDSLYNYRYSRFGRLTKLLHPSVFGDANLMHYNKNLILDKDGETYEENTDFIFEDSDESSLYCIKNNYTTMPNEVFDRLPRIYY